MNETQGRDSESQKTLNSQLEKPIKTGNETIILSNKREKEKAKMLEN